MSSYPEIRYSLVVPAYNEEDRIGHFFSQINGFPGEIIIVCDGTDQTPDVVSEISAKRPDLVIRCLAFPHRLGKGGGVIAGLKAARAPMVGFLDADGSASVAEMERLFGCLNEYDCAIGSRWVRGSVLTVQQGLLRRVESRMFNLFIRILFSLRFLDTQCGAKVFRKAAVDAVLPAMKARGFEFDVELLWRLQRAGFTIKEFPITWKNMGDSRVKSTDMGRMLSGLVRIRVFSGDK